MAKNPDRVYKPRFGLYKKVQAYTQHPNYAPKPFSWFVSYFNETAERVEHTLNYLVFKRFLMRTKNGEYGVDLDMRKRFKGRFLEIRGECFVHPDDHFMFIAVDRKYSFGARHNDRVQVAVNGYNEDGSFQPHGVVEKIIAPLSDRFCGRLDRDATGFYVIPDDRDLGRGVYLSEQDCDVPLGSYVYAELTNGDILRQQAYAMALPCQQHASISEHNLKGNYRDAYEYEPALRLCRIVMRASEDRHERYMLEKRFHTMLSPESKAIVEKPPRRINYIRKEYTNHNVVRVSSDLAYHAEKEEGGVRFYVHVPDLNDDIVALEPLGEELCYKGCMEGLVPESIRQNAAFDLQEKRRALTVSFTVNPLGGILNVEVARSRVVCQTETESELYSALKKHLPKDSRATHPLEKAAEVALAKLYAPTGEAFPYDNFVHSRKMKDFSAFLEKADQFEEKDKIFDCLDYYLYDRVLMNKPAGQVSGICFGQPFTRFESILTQWCLKHYLYPHRNKEYEIEFEGFVKDHTAVCMWQRAFFEEAKVLKRVTQWKKRHPIDDETYITGIYLAEESATPYAKHRFYVYSDENIILCEGVPEGTTAGTEVKFTVRAVHNNDVLLGTIRAVKKEN